MPEAYADLCRPHLYSDWQRRTRTPGCHHLSVQTANYAAKGPKFNPFLRELDKYNFGEGQLLAYVGFALLHRTPQNPMVSHLFPSRMAKKRHTMTHLYFVSTTSLAIFAKDQVDMSLIDPGNS